MNNEQLARRVVGNMFSGLSLKWVIIFGVTRALKRAAEKQAT